MNGADSIAAQRDRLLERLRKGEPVAFGELMRGCDVPSPSKRVCELIADGWPIERARGHTESEHGKRRTTYYRLSGPRRQRDLFD